MKKRAVSFITAMFMIFGFALWLPEMGMKASADAVSVEDLKARFPEGAYWNHVVNNYNQRADVLANNGDNSFADSVTWTPCQTHNGQPSYGNCDCNVFDGAMQCAGFAKKLSSDAYGSVCTSWASGSVSGASIKRGDVIHYFSSQTTDQWGHWFMVLNVNGNVLTCGECNANSMGDSSCNCKITWTRTVDRTSFYSKSVIYYAPYELPTHSHSYTGTVTKQPNCTEKGVKTFTCNCGASYTEEIAALGHDYVTTKVDVTMDADGYTIKKCSRCGDTKTENVVAKPVLNKDGWYYCDVLPSGISSDNYNIEYNNFYEKTQKDSPGSDWTKTDTVKNEWQNSGNQYTTETALETSDSRILVTEYYYHWCIPGAAMGSEGNYEMTSKFTHYDEIILPNEYIHVTSTGDDEGHTYYLLAWPGGQAVYCKSGEQCDGSYGYHDYRCRVWYKHYVYQDRIKVELYKYTKESGWTTAPDSTANSVKVRFKPSHVHNIVAIEAKAATCTADGNTAYWLCETCGKYFSDAACTAEITLESTVIPATGHKSKAVAAKAATCTEKGNKAYWVCTGCKKYFSDEACTKRIVKNSVVIQPKGHVLVHTDAKAATCTETGNTEFWRCKRCNKYYSDEACTKQIDKGGAVIPAKGHVLVHTDAKEATCTEDGNIEFWRCKRCNKYYSDKACTQVITKSSTVIKATGHTAVHKPAKAATCTEKGNKEYWVCTKCRNYYSDEDCNNRVIKKSVVIQPKGHAVVHVEAVAPSATKNGHTEYYRCKRCNKYFSDAECTKQITLKSTVIPKLES